MPRFMTVTIEGDREYIEGLKLLALSRKKHMGELVRQALDAAYGADMADVRRRAEIFFADDGTQKNHSVKKNTKRKEPTR